MRAPRLALPWYVHPAEAPQDWTWLAQQRVSFAVVNVHNGPGNDDDAYYPAAVAGLGRIRTLGYVPVGYGNRPVAEVAKDIETWRRLYGVRAIMLDELPSAEGTLARCTQYAAAARGAGVSFLAANPGVFPSPGHVKLFNVTSVFEGTAANYTQYRHPAWARMVPRSRLWHLVHSCNPAQISAIHLAAGHRGAGHIFATDRSLPNPWLGPPTAVSADLAAQAGADA